jgi:hypothetical protein
MSESKVKSGRGRTVGSYSFVTMKLGDLCNQLNPNTNIVLSRKWVEAIGLTATVAAKNSLETMKQTAVSSSAPAETPLEATIER